MGANTGLDPRGPNEGHVCETTHLCHAGDYHREGRSAGVFVPGVARGSIDGLEGFSPRARRVLRSKTLELGRPGSNDSLPELETPTPKHTGSTPQATPRTPATGSVPPTPTVLEPSLPQGSVPESIRSEELPDNQLGLEVASVRSHEPTEPAQVLEAKEVPAGSRSAASAPPAGEVVMEGTMYTDGTYWKRLGCCGCCVTALLGWIASLRGSNEGRARPARKS